MSQATYLGADHDLEKLIQTHLFVISPNNSGSTLLRRSFEISPSVWSLPREGQHVLGFAGPCTRETRDALIWNSSPERRARYLAAEAIDWQKSRKAWYFQARSRSPEASIFVTSSPPFLLNMRALQKNFSGARFILMTRNPFAVAEGILRRPIERLAPGEDRVAVAARHVGHCLLQMQENLRMAECPILHFTYEDMCADLQGTAARISAFLGNLEGYTLDQKIAVKGTYHERPRNMNAEALARLDPATMSGLRAEFARFRDAIEHFGYALDA